MFNYAVDACWKFPEGTPPYDVPDDFPPDANRPEAWRIVVNETLNTLWNDGIDNGGELSLAIDIYDWFNADLNTVRVESPGNFAMTESAVASGGGAGYSTYEIEITDATPAEGSIDLFISIESDSIGYGGLLPGKAITAYFTSSADVDDEAPVIGEGGVITFGGTGTEYILGFGVDSDGGKYSGGYFFDQANLDPAGNQPRPAQGSGGNMWLNKVSAAGEYEWGYTWPTMDGYHCYIWEIVADDNDDIYVVGHFVGTIDFDPGTGVDNHTASGGSGPLDAFLMKFDSDGNYIWGESWGGPENVTAFDIVLDGNDYAYITGYFFGTADIDPTSGVDSHTATSASGNVTDAYLIKVDIDDGSYIWGRDMGRQRHDIRFRLLGGWQRKSMRHRDMAGDGLSRPGRIDHAADIERRRGYIYGAVQFERRMAMGGRIRRRQLGPDKQCGERYIRQHIRHRRVGIVERRLRPGLGHYNRRRAGKL